MDPSHTPNAALNSPSPTQQLVTHAQAPTEHQGMADAGNALMPTELTGVDALMQSASETVATVVADSAPEPVSETSHSSLRPVKLQSIVNQTMSWAHGGEALPTPRYHAGQGFAKWISKAVGTTALKEKTEIQDLPAYRLRVSPYYPTAPHPLSHPLPDLLCPQLAPRSHRRPHLRLSVTSVRVLVCSLCLPKFKCECMQRQYLHGIRAHTRMMCVICTSPAANLITSRRCP